MMARGHIPRVKQVKVFITSSAQRRIFSPLNLLLLCVLMCGSNHKKCVSQEHFCKKKNNNNKERNEMKNLCNLLHFISNAHLNCIHEYSTKISITFGL